MEEHRTLTGWLELVEASPLIDKNNIYNLFKELMSEERTEGEIAWEDTKEYPSKISIIFFDFTPPNLEQYFERASKFLTGSEYMQFEYKTRFGPSDHTLCSFVVNSVGVLTRLWADEFYVKRKQLKG